MLFRIVNLLVGYISGFQCGISGHQDSIFVTHKKSTRRCWKQRTTKKGQRIRHKHRGEKKDLTVYSQSGHSGTKQGEAEHRGEGTEE